MTTRVMVKADSSGAIGVRNCRGGKGSARCGGGRAAAEASVVPATSPCCVWYRSGGRAVSPQEAAAERPAMLALMAAAAARLWAKDAYSKSRTVI